MDLRGKRILVVDDDLALRVLLQAILNRRGAITVVASDGMEAIAKLRDQPDLLVLDLLMPKADGFAVIEHLRAHAPSLLARTLIITAAPAKVRRSVQDLAVLHKPFDLDVLVAALETRVDAPPQLAARAPEPPPKRATGFATLPTEERRKLARAGGRVAQQKGAAHRFTPATARTAGRKGGEAVSRDRAHMARIARNGRPIKPAKEKRAPTMGEPDASDDAQTRLHNVRNAIAGIAGYAQALTKELPTALHAVIRAAHHAPEGDAARAISDGNITAVPELAFIMDLLAFTEDSAATALQLVHPGGPSPVDVHDTIRQAVTLHVRRFAERGGALRHDFAATRRTVTVDAGRLIAVWTNLLENALTAGARNATIQTTDKGKSIRIVVRDDGTGIPPAILPRLFEGISTKPGGGTGLKHVHGVITTLGGTITVASEPGDTAFTIVLPRASVASRS